MTTAEVTPTSIALAIIGGQKVTLTNLLVKIPTGEASVQNVFTGVFPTVANLMRALKGAGAVCLDTKVADILTGALAGVAILVNGSAFMCSNAAQRAFDCLS